MLRLEFKPQAPEFFEAAKEYASIWQDEGIAIVDTMEDVTGLRFLVTNVQALVFEGISRSEPLQLRASYETNVKRGTVIHELAHRICSENRLQLPNQDEPLQTGLHKQINLVLPTIWETLYGEEFTANMIIWESDPSRPHFYKEAWDWALSYPEQERRNIFSSLKKTRNSKVRPCNNMTLNYP